MTIIRIAPILGLFSVAGLSIIVTGCDDVDDAMRVFEGKPTKAQIAHEQQQSVALYVSPVPSVPVGAEPCLVVPAALFRTHWCNPDTLVLEPIP